MHRLLYTLITLTLLATACGDDTNPSDVADASTTTSTTPSTTTTPTTTTSTTTATSTARAPSGECAVIGGDGLPVAATGVTADEMLDRLGPGWTSELDDGYLVDVEGHHFRCGGERRFYGAWSTGDEEVITFVSSDHPDFVDPVGVGPGMLLADAVARHGGSATIGLSVELEQREFVVFADGGAPDWQYQVRGPSGYAGVYPEPLEGYVETTTLVEGAVIERIWWR